MGKAVPLSSPQELIKIDDHLNARVRGKALWSGKRLLDVPEPIFKHKGEQFHEEDIVLDNIISVSAVRKMMGLITGPAMKEGMYMCTI